MSFRLLISFITGLAILNAAFTTWSAAQDLHILTLGSLLIFSFIILFLADGIFSHAKRKNFLQKNNSFSPEAMYWNTFLSAMVYAWGGLCLLSVYIFSGLLWQHGVQYGMAATIIAICLFLYWHITDWNLRALILQRILASLHGISLMIGLGYLLFSGKLATARGDWAANYIFLCGGITLLLLCLYTLWSDINLSPSPKELRKK